VPPLAPRWPLAPAPPRAETPAGSAAPVTLVFMHYRPIKKEQLAPAWPTLSEKTNITIEVDNTNDSNQTELFTMLAADTGPDLWESNSRASAGLSSPSDPRPYIPKSVPKERP
jgi:hypothetical protein